MGKVKIYVCCAVICLSFLSLGFSETILLKSGQKVAGRIVEKTDKYVKLDFLGVDLVYYNDEIASIAQGVSNSENTVNPQMESLYQAYTSSLNVPQKPKEDKQASQITPAIAPTAGLSPEYQKMVQEVLKVIQGAQSGQAGGSKPAGMPAAGMDLSQLPPEYQKMIKSTMANLQTTNSKPPEEKK